MKNNLINKILNDGSKIKFTNKDWTELQKYDYLIAEIKSISNWPISLKIIVPFLGSGFLPAIITIIFKLIEIFVLK